MARDAELFNATNGSPLEGFLRMKKQGANVSPLWLENSRQSRVNRQVAVVQALHEGGWGDIDVLRDWEESYRKECFYYGMRILMELDRAGKTHL